MTAVLPLDALDDGPAHALGADARRRAVHQLRLFPALTEIQTLDGRKRPAGARREPQPRWSWASIRGSGARAVAFLIEMSEQLMNARSSDGAAPPRVDAVYEAGQQAFNRYGRAAPRVGLELVV